ncbi:flagellar hook-associated protein 2 [Peptoclostridium acidaminophilum DSM 3953]|uniref:Flagellar hook-associated protein 2 n=1 Tax=Peptoclostridium acidaminophilum DSM 3953 TaxID=1286171 RepID=W8T1R0_PEPAC|nr:flagellar filament capping protein FliD [Peptoclostridium acidaminophilum]AHM55649.1 flagellar hook-associated protein 2 [Peptoclostridium acidaminophilum DSM 3953]
MSTIRFGGIASGLDTESMVKELMKAERAKVDKLQQNKQTKTWVQEAYNDMNKSFANFILDSKKALGLTSTTSTGSTFTTSYSSLTWVKSASSSNESTFTATATTSAVSGTHNIEVKQLATGVNKASIKDIVARNVELGGALTDVTSTTELSELGIADGTLTFDGAAEAISYVSTDTIATLVGKINALKDADGNALGIKATFDETSNRLFLSTTAMGSNAQIKITDDGGGLFTGPASKFATDLDLNSELYVGQDAEINFDGAEGIKYSSNQFTINGITIDLKAAQPGVTNTIKVDTNIDGIIEKVKAFVDSYNTLVDSVNTKLGEKKYRDYQPLTDEQKEAMDEDTRKLWEEKAKSGLLRNDSTLQRTLQTIRSSLYEKVEGVSGAFSSMFEIGITTGSYTDKGKLEIDETKLREKIMQDPDGVMELLFKTSSSSDEETKKSETGIVNRIYDNMVEGMKDVIDKAGAGDNATLYRKVQSNIMIEFVVKGSKSLIDEDLLSIAKRIDTENDRLSNVEDRYWKRFTALEKAMQQMNSQSTWLSQQLGGGQ